MWLCETKSIKLENHNNQRVFDTETLSPGTKYQKLGGNDVVTICVCFILKNISRQSNVRGLFREEGTLLTVGNISEIYT